MNEEDLIEDDAVDTEDPPILGDWKTIYAIVLVLHLILLIAFYLFSRAYTV
ncbi:hypothetical protein CLV84_2820 [Neolewinella xylanilytica]|uniref:Uncharacterized protein n=1 Tax=Neolewinella xylanilytica TaxID=1514080 RepID=A0A2S6I3Y9_9BACT|nr:hypothetical protein [Neolewinella xylanilytica]PPK85908.1 hypothetical protein CLV84_2820 [Neolewinella xylanilytica]